MHIFKLDGVNSYRMESPLWWSPSTVSYSPADSEKRVSANFGGFPLSGTLVAPPYGGTVEDATLMWTNAATPWYRRVVPPPPPPLPPTAPPPILPSPYMPGFTDFTQMIGRFTIPATPSIGLPTDSIASFTAHANNELRITFDPVR